MKADLITPESPRLRVPRLGGLRVSAESFYSLEDDGFKYELVNGVLLVSPSPTPQHQQVLAEILFQFKLFLRDHSVGSVFPETDVRLADDLVYRPELVFLRKDRVQANWRRITDAPDVVVEVISSDSRRYDLETKRGDYERFGVGEYWVIDPERQSMLFLRLEGDRFVEAAVEGNRFVSAAVPGFELDLASIRDAFEPMG